MLTIFPKSIDASPSRVDEQHEHYEAQILFAQSGVMLASCADMSWIIPPQRALWIPPQVPHRVSYRGPVCLRTLYFSTEPNMIFPKSVRLIEVSPLLRELILEAAKVDRTEDAERDIYLKMLILLEINHAAAAVTMDTNIRCPVDRRLHKMCLSIMEKPCDNRSIDEWASIVGMSRRTLTRHFRQETGLSFGLWRQQVRLNDAVARLRMGESVTTIAYEIGYESAATFSTIFRQNFGISPSRFKIAG